MYHNENIIAIIAILYIECTYYYFSSRKFAFSREILKF